MDSLLHILLATWQVLVLMAPYLLLGFAVAGVVSVLLSPDWVRRHMGGRGLWQVVKAALVGVPLPLCSCGVLPVALSLRQQGASRGAVASFLASTPQTGVDSILATYVVLGPVVSVFRVAAAFVSGLLAGGLVTAAYPREQLAGATEDTPCACQPPVRVPAWKRILRTGFVTLPRDMARPLLLGVLVSGGLTVLVPAGFFQGHLPPGWQGYGLALLVGIPLYVCSTASIPLAASFVYMGASPGAAMVFLIAGPATNAAMLVAMWSRIGKAGTGLYLLAIVVTAIASGWLLDVFFPAALAAVPALGERCAACASQGWGGAAAVVLLIMLAPGLWNKP
ncbi:MAG: permease [Kiritimatiellia bacterium]